MPATHLITGPAGTGKTTRLLALANEHGPDLLRRDDRRLLAMAFMHGARKRLANRLNQDHPGLRATVQTIDSFALSVLNKWRSALGFRKPILPSGDRAGSEAEDDFFAYLPFEQIRGHAARLVCSPTVGRILAASFPVVVIDEFQDCDGQRLELIKAIAARCMVLLAADPFQRLEQDDKGCPAVEWGEALADAGDGTIEELATPYRFGVPGLLQGAHALRSNVASPSVTVPVICCAGHGLAAFEILRRLALNDSEDRWRGRCALISPTADDLVEKVLESLAQQAQKKDLRPIHWVVEKRDYGNPEEAVRRVSEALYSGAAGPEGADDPNWDGICETALAKIRRFARLRGVDQMPGSIIRTFTDRVAVEARAFGPERGRRVVTTVHGAKNREFDHVVVLWNPYRVARWGREMQRRLLYNAVTRARKDCIVLTRGSASSVASDSVLCLLGPVRDSSIGRRQRPHSVRAITGLNSP